MYTYVRKRVGLIMYTHPFQHNTYTHTHPFQPHAFTHVRTCVRTYVPKFTYTLYVRTIRVVRRVLRCIVNCILYIVHRGDVTIGSIVRTYVLTYVPCHDQAQDRSRSPPATAPSPAHHGFVVELLVEFLVELLASSTVAGRWRTVAGR